MSQSNCRSLYQRSKSIRLTMEVKRVELKGKFAVVAGSGGSMPQKSVKPPWLDRTSFPFRSRFIEIDGNTVHYIDEGGGQVLLMLHGNPTYSFLSRHIVRIVR